MPERTDAVAVRFAEIKSILDELVEGRDPQHMQDAHNDTGFGWTTLAQLQKVVVRPLGPDGPEYPLIDMELVRRGEGDKTNLVKALKDGVESFGRMPYSPPPGRYATEREIQTIIAWLDAGMPE